MKQFISFVAAMMLATLRLGSAQELKEESPVPKAVPQETGSLTVGENKATPVERIRTAKGFKVELLYSVPRTEGSWVNVCVDGKGRIIASDQYGALYRFAPPPLGKTLGASQIEKIPADIRAANGLLWAFNGLYVVVNDYEKKIESGLYRVTSSRGDDTLDKVELLRAFTTKGDHGVHAILLSPDKKSLFLVTGNGTTPTEFSSSRVPLNWGEDHLLPRIPDGRGFMREVLAPGGIIYQVSPEGKKFEIYSSGYRNIFDAALNRDGELFTYDADMEYDFNTSWYRPTRICHVVSGSEFGWRNGTGKWPEWYPDNLPPVLNVGPGSPTGMTFGYGAKFPAKYQEALFGLDWSWGKIFAVHLVPNGSTYTARKEEFISGAPLPVTDAIINPTDGAMYFTIGGRKVQSGLYRVTYIGKDSIAAAPSSAEGRSARKLRYKLEAFHGRQDTRAVKKAWPYLDHEDRFIRWAARVAIEWQPHSQWADKALSEKSPVRQLEALLALTHVTGIDPLHRKPNDPPPDAKMSRRILEALVKIDWSRLNHEQRISLVRTYQICFVRFDQPDTATAQRVLWQLDPKFPADTQELNRVLCETLVYLQSPNVAARGMRLLSQAPAQEEQIEYARSLRMLKAGWTMELREAYFAWFLKAANYRGGASFERFIQIIREDAVASLSESEKEALKAVLAKTAEKKSPLQAMAEVFAGRTSYKEWKMEDFASLQENPSSNVALKNRDFQNGLKMFGAVGCFACHRFGNDGGMTGPDLTSAGLRYNAKDLLDQILNPSKEINEQFQPMLITKLDGDTVSGVIVNLNGDTIRVNTDPASPWELAIVDRKEVKSIETSKTSLMPEGLLNLLTKEEILDLLAYVLSGGDSKDRMFTRR
jgi:putative heme-binding domain-containing protein